MNRSSESKTYGNSVLESLCDYSRLDRSEIFFLEGWTGDRGVGEWSAVAPELSGIWRVFGEDTLGHRNVETRWLRLRVEFRYVSFFLLNEEESVELK